MRQTVAKVRISSPVAKDHPKAVRGIAKIVLGSVLLV